MSNSVLKTVGDIEKYNEQFREKTEKAKKTTVPASAEVKASYDIEKAFNPADIPTKTKKSR